MILVVVGSLAVTLALLAFGDGALGVRGPAGGEPTGRGSGGRAVGGRGAGEAAS